MITIMILIDKFYQRKEAYKIPKQTPSILFINENAYCNLMTL